MSAVIAVILLIGCVILLSIATAGMIFLLIQDQPESPPSVAFETSEESDRWTLNTAPSEIKWSEYEMRVFGNAGTVKVRLNSDAGVAGLNLDAGPQALPASDFPGDLTGGQFLDFCAAQEEHDTRFLLVHSQSGARAHQATFSMMPASPTCI